MADASHCAECGAVLPAHWPQGPCPRCALQHALELGPCPSALDLPPSTPVLPVPERPGDRIGRYKLLQQIGEGGCGVVYMAEQEEPVRRRVALKVIKMGMDTKQVIARFEAERQALALMDHPNIAKIYDAGITAVPLTPALSPSDGEREAVSAGRPYFVMELVRGIKITDYCDQNKLSTEERLSLFIQVCHAIQHAHQKGIIHRDIKPSNIMVTLHDAVPVPKVIDFGIAKAIEQRLTDKTVFTAYKEFIGTPAYVSPEQAEMSGLDIDTRTDIYSLGVLLYELLTGQTPFDDEKWTRAGLDEIRRTIREVEPPRPSTRLSTMVEGQLTTTAKQRHTDAPKLIHLIRGDLDWIVMKALEKDRTRRYETANGLAMDVQRHLDDEPVVACPPSKVYRFGRLMRRHKLAFAAASAIATVLVVGVLASTWQALRATRAEREQTRLRQQAEAARNNEVLARQQAESAAKKSVDVLRFTRDMVARSGGSYVDQVTVLQMLNRGAADAEGKFIDQPDVAASVQFSIGYCYSRIGKWDEARKYLRRALDLHEQLWGDLNLDTLEAARELASVALSQGQKEEAQQRCQQILDATRRGIAAGRSPKEKQGFRSCELWACRKLAQAYLEAGELAKAKPFVDELLAAAKAKELSAVEAGHAWSEAGTLALAQGHPLEALADFEAELPFYTEANFVQRAWADGSRGAAYLALGEYEKAEPLLTSSLPVLEHRFGATHWRVQGAFRDLASLCEKTGRPDQAAEWKRKLTKPNNESKDAETDGIYRAWLQAARQARGLEADDPQLAQVLATRTRDLLEEGRFADAERSARDCLAIREKKLPDDWSTFNSRSVLGASLLGQKKYAVAEPLLRSGYEGMKQREEKMPPAEKLSLRGTLLRLVQLYEATHRPDEAAEWKKKLAEFDHAPGPQGSSN